jgi:hypothetical protein
MSVAGVTGMAVSGVRGVGPLPDWAYIYMDKLASGIIANSSGIERQGRVAHERGRDAVDSEVNGLGDNVLRVLSRIGRSAGAKFVIGFLGAVARQHVDDGIGFAQLGEHGVQYVEGAWIVLVHFFVVRVPEESIQLVERLGNVGITDAVDDVDHLSCMAVRQLDLVFFTACGENVRIICKKSGTGQSCVHKDVGKSVKPGMPVCDRLAGSGCG